MQNNNNLSANHGNQEYTAKDIQVLDGLEAVRIRPGMYIGSIDQRGLHHLVYEIVYNSIDEAMAGYCGQISVSLLPDKTVRVQDDGRGIPVEVHPATGVSALETVMTKLHAGAKFSNGSYKVSSGLHGVGASVVNALSKWLKVEVRRDGKKWEQIYEKGIPRGPAREVGEATGSGTTVTFLADEEIFGKVNYEFDVLAERFRELCYLNKCIRICFRDESTDREMSFYFEGGLSSFVRQLNRNNQVLHPKPVYIFQGSNGTMIEISIQYNDTYSETFYSFANCVNTEEGGSHLTGFRAALTRVLNDYARKAKLLKEDEGNLTGDDVRAGLMGAISVKLPHPVFEGQTKTKLGNPEVKGQVESVMSDNLSLYLDGHPEESKNIINKCMTAARAREAAKKARDLIIRKTSLDTGTLPGKLADCSDKDPEHTEIYLVEGDSAGGSAKQGRDRRFQAILPLRGKILNVEKSPEKLLKHEEIRAIITALGIGLERPVNLTKLRYGRVIIMTDADVDGSHIRTLLLTFFYRDMIDLVKEGHLYIARPPLYRIQNHKEVHWVYTEAEKDVLVKSLGSKKVEIQRYKGLGEMSPQQLWDTTMNPESRTMLRVNMMDPQKANETFQVLMGDEVPPRKAFIQAYATSVKNLDV